MTTELRGTGLPTGDHVVLFYESDSQLASEVGAYLTEGLEAGEVAIVVATEAHLDAFSAAVAASGVDPVEARRQGRLISLDAATTLAAIVTENGIDPAAFRKVVGSVVREAVQTGRPVRAYGEMVALLWESGDVQSVIELETRWNELGSEVPFSLFCAYPSEAVSGSGHADAVHQVCKLHSSVVGSSTPTGVERHAHSRAETRLTAEFAAELGSPRAARRLVAAALRERGHTDALVGDAALVLTELATNAVVHARSPFTVTVREDDSFVRISVADSETHPPSPRVNGHQTNSGRGLALVTAIATRWGFETTPDGKVVWADLSSSA